MSSLDELELKLDELQYSIAKLERRVQKPFAIIEQNRVRGFRYGKPGIIHYTVINLANTANTLQSIDLLLESGFQGPAVTLMRSVLESNSKLSYVIGGLKNGNIDKKSEKFLADYFSDNVRDDSKRKQYQPISQKDIHRRNSESVSENLQSLRDFGLAKNISNDGDKFADIQSYLYRIFSNQLHGRYPEMMDIFGEKSRELKMQGDFESKDMDASVEREFVLHLVEGAARQLRIALVYFQAAGLLSMCEEERKFVFADAF